MLPRRPLLARVNHRAGAALARLAPATQVRLSGRPPIELDGQTLDPELQLLLATRDRLGVPPFDARLSPRRYRDLLAVEAATGAGRPLAVGATAELTLPGPGGALRARHYTPPGAAAGRPLLVFLHGGGFVVGDIDTHDAPCRLLCRSGLHVLSVDYRLAPEHAFPAAQQDAVAAFAWAVEHAERLGADPARVLVGGDSAGGMLSAHVALAALAGDCPPPALQLLIYPVTDNVTRYRSQDLFADGFFLTEPMLDWYASHFLPDRALAGDPRWSPLLADDVAGAAPTVMVTAGFDPLRDMGEAYADRLRTAGVPVVTRRFDSLIHGFINFVGVSAACRDGVAEMAGLTRSALELTA